MITPAIREAYLNRLTDNGRKFFALLLSEAFGTELTDQMQIPHPTERITYYFGIDPLTKQWFGYPEGIPPMFMIEFTSYHHECSFDKSFWFIRRQFIPPTVQSTDWPAAIELASHYPSSLEESTSDPLKEISEDVLRKIREVQEKNWQEYQAEQSQLMNQKYETTPAEALLFYFRPGKKDISRLWTATEVVSFMNLQHPGFWKLSEEETGRLLNSEGFVICKGRHKGVRGYFLSYREGFKPGVYMELKVAS